jgi:hypothetical protein
MLEILFAAVLAALVYLLLTALGLPPPVGIIAAIVVPVVGVSIKGFGAGDRFSRRRL